MCNKRGLQKRSGYMLLPKVNDVWLPNCPSVSYTEPHYHGNSISMAIREELHTHIHTHTHAHTHIHTHAHAHTHAHTHVLKSKQHSLDPCATSEVHKGLKQRPQGVTSLHRLEAPQQIPAVRLRSAKQCGYDLASLDFFKPLLQYFSIILAVRQSATTNSSSARQGHRENAGVHSGMHGQGELVHRDTTLMKQLLSSMQHRCGKYKYKVARTGERRVEHTQLTCWLMLKDTRGRPHRFANRDTSVVFPVPVSPTKSTGSVCVGGWV